MDSIIKNQILATGRACGKLLLFGEHTAVYGYPAIGIPLPWEIKVNIREATKHSWKVQDEKDISQLEHLFQKLFAEFPELKELPPFVIETESTLPKGLGFGSSGALCVALVRAFFPNKEKKELWEAAHQLETIFHGTPSGIDTGISVFEKMCAYERKESNRQIPECLILKNSDLPIAIGVLPRKTTTATLIANLAERKKRDQTVEKHLTSLGILAKTAIEMFKEKEVSLHHLGHLSLIAHEHLSALDLSTPELDQAIRLGMSYGALGGKLSGAGGGGAFYLIAESHQKAQILQEMLINEGLSPNSI